MEKLYRVQMNSKGAPDFSTAVEVEDKPSVDKDYLIRLIQEAVYDGEACAKLLDLVDRPQGEWIQNVFRSDIYRYECSNCKAHHRARYDFCPSCGTRMKGSDDE